MAIRPRWVLATLLKMRWVMSCLLICPKVGVSLAAEAELGEVESTKATSTIYSPVTGSVVQVNQDLEEHPEFLNQDPYGRGWIAVLELSNPGEVDALMTAEQYEAFLTSQE